MLKKLSFIIRDTTLLHSSSALTRNILIHKAWKEIRVKGLELNSIAKINKIQESTIYILASEPAYAQELQIRNIQILRKINKLLPQNFLKLSKIIIRSELI